MDKEKLSVVHDGAATAAMSVVSKPTNRSNSSPLDAAEAPAPLDSRKSSQQSSASTSVTQSPQESRESSPTRNPRRTTSSSRLSNAKSRTGSQQDLSPTRQMRSSLSGRTPSSRSLSSTTYPSLQPAAQSPTIQSPTPQKTAVTDLKDSPRWPVSPRLRSPPPQNPKATTMTSAASARRTDQEPPAIAVQRPTPSPGPSDSQATTSESDADDQLQSGIRTPARGALETVQEVSLPSSPSPPTDTNLFARLSERLENQSDSVINEPHTLRARSYLSTQDSGSDTGSSKRDRRPASVPPPPLVTSQSSGMSSKQLKTKQDISTQKMTVETETVASIPHVALGSTSKADSVNGTLKNKPSTETIKPRKEKRKTSRKAPSVTAGTASSKADIFEATIASAVDADTSDSEETFVYDSNPPDGGERTSRRFHSRTPSTTSMASQADRQHLRSIYGVLESGPAHGAKKGMKFVNSVTSNGQDALTPDDEGKGTGRSVGGSNRGTARHHHHIGRWGRQPHGNHTSIFDKDSPFPNAAKTKLNGSQSRTSSNPPSPRNLSHKRSNIQLSSYDIDDTTGADDERTPLMGTARTQRSRRTRRGPHNLRQAESQTFNRKPSYLTRFAACLVLTMMFLLVITGAIGFMFATSQPLTDIQIVSIRNIVASEQVLMFDLTLSAHNPNIVVVTIDKANLEIFAKSEHAGSDSDWVKDPNKPPKPPKPPHNDAHITDDPPNDPPLDDDDDDSRPNVLLGRITEFDSPLTFEGSLFHQGSSKSTGEVQLPYPGNGTAGGSERWERIYQDEFDLVIKGVVKYTLPLSARVRSATVSGRTGVRPNSATQDDLDDP